MSLFNQNLRFMCKRMKLTQQGLADLMDVKRGKVAGYFYQSQAKPDFHQKLKEHFDIDIGMFLTVEMTLENYEQFFGLKRTISSETQVDPTPSSVFKLLVDLKNQKKEEDRNKLIDKVLVLYGELLEENKNLKDELITLMRKNK